jgi:hypothetical protein
MASTVGPAAALILLVTGWRGTSSADPVRT